MATLKFDRKAFFADIQESFVDTMFDAGNHMQTYITEEKRDYPNVTVRQIGAGVTGKVAGSPRDAVDRGDLRDSFDVEVVYEGKVTIVKVEWSAEHAEYVYFGGNQPPYPWITLALQQMNLEKEFWRNWEKRSKGKTY